MVCICLRLPVQGSGISDLTSDCTFVLAVALPVAWPKQSFLEPTTSEPLRKYCHMNHRVHIAVFVSIPDLAMYFGDKCKPYKPLNPNPHA